MKDVGLPLRTGYFTLLNNIIVDGRQIPAFDMVAPLTAKPPYVIISDIMYVSDNTKDTFGGEVTVDLLIYARSDGDFGGRKTTDLIGNAVMGLVIPAPGRSGVAAEGFDVIMAKLVNSEDEMDYAATGRKYRKRLVIEHIAWEQKD